MPKLPHRTIVARGPPPVAPLVVSTDSSVRNGHASQARRVHTKSRNGCFNCKRRRIKCQENRPACSYCVRAGLKCEYPVALQVVQPSQTIPLFSLQDMRFFQHFIVNCFPRHPLGNEDIWMHEVPCLSHKYEYLMHGILGLAASDLIASDFTLAEAAMVHRLKAVQHLKRKLACSDSKITYAEGSALIATCFALVFQSMVLEDGMAEYMAFMRGMKFVAIKMLEAGAKLIFKDFLQIEQDAILEVYVGSAVFLDVLPGWSPAAMASLEELRSLCIGDALKMKYLQLTDDIAKALSQKFPYAAFKAMNAHYTWWMMLPHSDFVRVVNPEDQVFTLLATHWIALKKIKAMITNAQEGMAVKKKALDDKGGNEGVGRWLRWLNKQVKPQYRQYNQWPLWVQAQQSSGLTDSCARMIGEPEEPVRTSTRVPALPHSLCD